MRKLTFALVGLTASLAAAPLLAQTPQTNPPTTSPAAGPAASPKSGAAAAPGAKSMAEKPAVIDINSATKEELDALPGIGAVRAEAIIKGRPYKGKDELHRKKIIPMNVYEGVKDQIVARQS